MYATIQSVPMEGEEAPPRLHGLPEGVHGLQKLRWLGKLWRAMAEQGGEAVSENGRNGTAGIPIPHGFKIPRPTHMAGAYTEPIVPNEPPSGPTQDEIENRPFLDAAMAVKHPWADEEPPPLYSRRSQS